MKNFEVIKYKDIDVKISVFERKAYLSINDMSLLFNKSRTVISKHIKNINLECAQKGRGICAKNARIPGENNREYVVKLYDIEVAKMVGVRVKSNEYLLLEKFLSENLEAYSSTIKNNEIIIYDNGVVHIPLKFSKKDQMILATQDQIADLFETTQSNVSKHIKNIIEDNEINTNSVYENYSYTDSISKDFLHMGTDGKQYMVTFYTLDMILAVGYRVRTSKAIAFRNWASSILKEYILEGYSINEQKCLECQNKLLEIQNEILQLKAEIQYQITFHPDQELISFTAIEKFLKCAKREIIIVDNYFGHDFDLVLSKLNVKKTIITNPQNKKIESNDNYEVIKINSDHDRYLIVDDACYHFGQSFADLGSKLSTATKVKDEETINLLKSFTRK